MQRKDVNQDTHQTHHQHPGEDASQNFTKLAQENKP